MHRNLGMLRRMVLELRGSISLFFQLAYHPCPYLHLMGKIVISDASNGLYKIWIHIHPLNGGIFALPRILLLKWMMNLEDHGTGFVLLSTVDPLLVKTLLFSNP